MLRTITDYNNPNDAPLSNENIREVIHKVIEEESDAHNVTVDNFSHMPDTQWENATTIFTIEKLHKSDELAETLKDLTINDTEYYASKSVNTNDKKVNPESDPKTLTHTSDEEGKFTDNRNGNFQQLFLSNHTLPVVVL